jgi:hypothetical protein
MHQLSHPAYVFRRWSVRRFQEPEICRKFAIKNAALRKVCTAKIIPEGIFL